MNARASKWVIVVTLFEVLALPAQLAAQHTRFRLIDLGTLGGTNSYQTFPAQSINNKGEVIAFADTTVPDPFAPICLQNDCLISHAVVLRQDRLTDLGALPGVNDSIPAWISASGFVAGISENGMLDPLIGFPQLQAVLWDRAGNTTDLGTLGGNSSLALAVNSVGHVVGVAANSLPDDFSGVMLPSATQARAFLWQDGQMRDLGTLGGNDAIALDINERGQVIGFSFTNSSPNATTGLPTAHPFLWEQGAMKDLGSLGGTFAVPGSLTGTFSVGAGGVDLNNRGEVVGTSSLAGDDTWHPFLWSGGVLNDLGTLGGNKGEAFFISDSGYVVGRADISPLNTIHHAFLWKGGVMTDLGALPPCLNSTATSVNSAGQVIGETGRCPAGGDGPAFFSEHGEPMVALNDLVLPGSNLNITGGAFINDRGEIAGLGVLPNGDTRAVLLVPATAAEIAAADALNANQSPARPSGSSTPRSKSGYRSRRSED